MRSGAVTPAPRWLVDEMLGRLARYLRFVGCDTVYVRGAADDELLERARREGRVLLTRDRELSRRARASFLVESPHLAEQWRAVRAAYPTVPTTVAFDRCTLCNGRLEPEDAGPAGSLADAPPELPRRGPLYRCCECGHRYWEGSHTSSIRARLATWEASGPQ